MIRILTAAMFTLGIASAAFVQAQTAPPPAAQPGKNYTDTDLKSFAVAVLEVNRIKQAYLPKFQSAATPKEQMDVQNKATVEMEKAVSKQGMTVDKYQEILAHAQNNPEVADKVNALIKESETKGAKK